MGNQSSKQSKSKSRQDKSAVPEKYVVSATTTTTKVDLSDDSDYRKTQKQAIEDAVKGFFEVSSDNKVNKVRLHCHGEKLHVLLYCDEYVQKTDIEICGIYKVVLNIFSERVISMSTNEFITVSKSFKDEELIEIETGSYVYESPTPEYLETSKQAIQDAVTEHTEQITEKKIVVIRLHCDGEKLHVLYYHDDGHAAKHILDINTCCQKTLGAFSKRVARMDESVFIDITKSFEDDELSEIEDGTYKIKLEKVDSAL